MENRTNSLRRHGRAIRQFSLIWTKPPSDQAIIRVGAGILRGYLVHQRAARENER